MNSFVDALNSDLHRIARIQEASGVRPLAEHLTELARRINEAAQRREATP